MIPKFIFSFEINSIMNTNLSVIILIVCLTSQVAATCQCATTFSSGSDSYWRNEGCSDYELEKECKRAEWELVDYVNGFVRYGVAIIEDSTNVTQQDAVNLAALSYALEVQRPVPDCATGLFTKNPIEG